MATQEVSYVCLPSAIANGGTGTDWKTPANILALDMATAYAPLATSAAMKNLDLTGVFPVSPGFRAMVSQNTTQFSITAISVVVYRFTDVAATVRDTTLQLLVNGSTIGNNLADTSTNWPTSRGSASYGGGLGVWGTFPTLSDFLNGLVGLRFKATNSSGSLTCVPEVDYIEITLTLTQPALPTGLPIGKVPAFEDIRLVPSPSDFERLVMRSDGLVSNVIVAAETTGYNETTAETTSFYWCSGPIGGIRVDLDNDGELDTQFEHAFVQSLEFDYRLFASPRVVADSSPSPGRATLVNQDGRNDYLNDYTFKGRTITFKAGAKDLDYSAWPTIATLVIDNLVVSGETIDIQMVDRRRLLNATLQPVHYAANFTVSELAGATMPFGFGAMLNVKGHGIGADTLKLMGDFPMKDFTEVRVDGAVYVDTTATEDLINGTYEFSSLPEGEIRFDIQGIQARNVLIKNRDATASDWIKTNCTASILAFGVDGTADRGFRLTASANNATCNPTVHESPASPIQWEYAIHSYYMRMVSGSGIVSIGTDPTAIQLTTEWARYFVVQTTPGFPIGGITIASSGDVIEVDFAQYEPARYYPSPPIDTTGLGAAGTNYPNTAPAIIKFILTARAGLVPFVDFDEASFTLAAQKTEATMNWWWTEDTTVLDALGPFLESGRLGLIMDRTGRAKIDRVGLPESLPVANFTEKTLFPDAAIAEPEGRIGRVRALCERKWEVNAKFDPALDADTIERHSREWVAREEDDAAILAIIGDTADATAIVETAFDDPDDAARWAIEELALRKEQRRPMVLPTTIGALLIDPMQCIRVSAPTLTHNRGEARQIRDLQVRSVSLRMSEERVTLEAWG